MSGPGLEPRLDAFLGFAHAAQASVAAFPEWRAWTLAQGAAAEPRGFRRLRIDAREFMAGADSFLSKLDALRRFRRREMLRIGFRDWLGVPLEESLGDLSALADVCLAEAAVLSMGEIEGRFGPSGTPWIVLALGKLGGRELNYSSDVDLMIVYAEDGDASPRLTRHEWFNRWGALFTSSVAARTAAGWLFRVDMRLRPDGDAGPLSRSVESCENYYAAFGDTWERLALMKARRVAGDEELAYDFGLTLQPFCYPRILSPAMFTGIARVKERIETEILDAQSRETDIKRGAGGIREIEFTIQVPQLLHGGRQPQLQEPSTLRALDALLRAGLMPRESADALRAAYRFLRRVEHRLQMVDEQQTHELPTDPERRATLAASLGFASTETFDAELAGHRARVRALFEHQLAEAPQPDARANVWAAFPEDVRRLAVQLRDGPAHANVPARTREAFERLEPLLASHLAGLTAPADALVGLERFAERYGSRGHLYETWLSSPRVLDLLLRLFDASHQFRDLLVAHPDWLETVCRNASIDAVWSVDEYARLAAEVDSLGALRLWRWEQGLRIAIQDVLGLITAPAREAQHTALAEACLRWVLHDAGAGGLIVLAAGKFGGRELNYGSDLDLVFLEGTPGIAREVVSRLTHVAPEGRLYGADARLRPEGNAGPLTLGIPEAVHYYKVRAQPWEFLAFQKFRLVAGPEESAAAFLEPVRGLATARASDTEWPKAVAAMRELVARGRGKDGHAELELKTAPGGIMDVEFAAQAWQARKGLAEPATRGVLEAMAAEGAEEAAPLREGYEFLRRLESVIRRFDASARTAIPKDPAAREELARRAAFPNAAAMLEDLAAVKASVRAGYEKVLARLAGAGACGVRQ